MRTLRAGEVPTVSRPHVPVFRWLSQLQGGPHDGNNCGPTTVAIVARAFGAVPGGDDLKLIERLRAARGRAGTDPVTGGGTVPRGIATMARSVGLAAKVERGFSERYLASALAHRRAVVMSGDGGMLWTPDILRDGPWKRSRTQPHWVVVSGRAPDGRFRVLDPGVPASSEGRRTLSWEQLDAFMRGRDGRSRWQAVVQIGRGRL